MNWYLQVLKKYAVLRGRARRKEYWMFHLFNFIIALVLVIIASIISFAIKIDPSEFVDGLLTLYSLAVLLPGLAVAVRRLHDTGRSGLWLLILLVPIIGALVLLVFVVQDSQPGENQYGPNPKGIVAA